MLCLTFGSVCDLCFSNWVVSRSSQNWLGVVCMCFVFHVSLAVGHTLKGKRGSAD